MEDNQTTNAPAQDKSHLRLGRFMNTGTLAEIMGMPNYYKD